MKYRLAAPVAAATFARTWLLLIRTLPYHFSFVNISLHLKHLHRAPFGIAFQPKYRFGDSLGTPQERESVRS
jgi:hypothetical protein